MEVFRNRMLRRTLGCERFSASTLSKCACYWGDYIKDCTDAQSA